MDHVGEPPLTQAGAGAVAQEVDSDGGGRAQDLGCWVKETGEDNRCRGGFEPCGFGSWRRGLW